MTDTTPTPDNNQPDTTAENTPQPEESSSEVFINREAIQRQASETKALKEEEDEIVQSFAKERQQSDVVVISRTTLNYVVIAIAFFVLGLGLGFFTFGSNTTASVDEDVISEVMRELMVEAGLVHPRVDNMYTLVDDDPYIGEADAPIVMVEFSAYACPYCGQHYNTTLEPLLENYGEYIRYVYRDHPIINEQYSFAAAIAANCALEQDKFWEFHRLIFANQQSIATAFFLQSAEDLEMDVDQFTDCYQNGRYVDEVVNDTNEATALNITGTPAFYINGTFHSGARSYDYFERIILQELDKLNIDI